MKPIIGITTFLKSKQSPDRVYASVSQNYVRSVAMAGGIPVLIPILDEQADLGAYIDMIDGLLLTGGEDLAPLTYGEDPLPQVRYFSVERDAQEFELFRMAYDRKMPILGICRGHQLMNVALKGTLYQDLGAQYPGALGHAPMENPAGSLYHRIRIVPGSRLHTLLGQEELAVNSFHHQAVKVLGDTLRGTAYSSEGVIEAFESVEDRFLTGVQWHPEDLTGQHPIFLRLFEALVESCRK